MHAESLDLRPEIVRACDQRRGSHRAIAILWGVSQAVLEQLRRQRRATGALSARPHAGGRRPIGDATAIAHGRRLVQARSDATRAA